MSSRLPRVALLLLFSATLGCDRQAREPRQDATTTAAERTPPRPQPGPPLRADGSFDTDAMMAENDRIITENNRIAKTIAARQQADPAKFDRLKTGCETKLGTASDATLARAIFQCIESGW